MTKPLGLIEFIQRAKIVHGDNYDYSLVSYINNHTKVIIKCNHHGRFTMRPLSHIRGQGCPRCGVARRSLKRLSSKQIFITKATKRHGDIYNYDLVEYSKSNKKVSIICSEHGVFYQTPNKHLRGQGCTRCVKTFSTEDFILNARKKHGVKYSYVVSHYSGAYNKIWITCPSHGDFLQDPHDHLMGKGCKQCVHTISKPETLWLDFLKIPKSCRNKHIRVGNRRFLVDAYVASNNTIYEFNGDFWHGNPKKFSPEHIHPIKKISYADLHQKTLQRENFLRVRGYNVISIWESDFVKQMVNYGMARSSARRE